MGKADPIPSNDPIAVAMGSGTDEENLGAPRRRVRFEELLSEDDIDVPDFMK